MSRQLKEDDQVLRVPDGRSTVRTGVQGQRGRQVGGGQVLLGRGSSSRRTRMGLGSRAEQGRGEVARP